MELRKISMIDLLHADIRAPECEYHKLLKHPGEITKRCSHIASVLVDDNPVCRRHAGELLLEHCITNSIFEI